MCHFTTERSRLIWAVLLLTLAFLVISLLMRSGISTFPASEPELPDFTPARSSLFAVLAIVFACITPALTYNVMADNPDARSRAAVTIVAIIELLIIGQMFWLWPWQLS